MLVRRTRTMLVCALTICAFLGGAFALALARDDKPETEAKYAQFVDFHYGRAMVGGVGFKNCTTGVTTATLESDAKKTRVLLSVAFPKKGSVDLAHLQVSARTKDGRVVGEKRVGGASGSGTEHQVVSVISEFSVPATLIERLVVQRRMHSG